jgi:hypothetical protein
MLKGTIKGALIAGAVAGLFASGAAVAKDAKPKEAAKIVKCGGVNECKGKGACAGADNSCKSHNECKGKGWTETTEKDCKDKGGRVMAAK